jgi:acetyl esterase/lipase
VQPALSPFVSRPRLGAALGAGMVILALASGGSSSVHAEESAAAVRSPEKLAIDELLDVEYAKRDNQALRLDIFRPQGAGPYPAVALVHGGGWMSGNRSRMHFLARKLAQRGFAAVPVEYRLAPKHKYPAQVDDCRDAILWLREHADEQKIDARRIGGWGYSAGAQLVSLLGASDQAARGDAAAGTPLLAAVVAGGTPCDFRLLPPDQRALVYWLGGTRREREQTYVEASPRAFVSMDDPPFFFYHGADDLLVPREPVRLMREDLARVGVEATLHVVPRGGHIMAFFDAQAIDQACGFLATHLQP